MPAIQLRGGLLVQTEAIALALALESRGVTLVAKDGVLTARPASALSAEDTAAIRRWRWQLLALAAYDADAS